MTDLTITLKNIPREVKLMLDVAFKQVPTMFFDKGIEVPGALNIDFDAIDEAKMRSETLEASQLLIMAAGWQAFQKVQNES